MLLGDFVKLNRDGQVPRGWRKVWKGAKLQPYRPRKNVQLPATVMLGQQGQITIAFFFRAERGADGTVLRRQHLQ
ncbi:hypothetical protein B0T14DRAFT_524881 [Immersiella caudata]|uniref:Uncharacterized protein n=1 Tax=Immersiella caudata TaxID=314043 RepID=A0AA39WKY9_9PEZI|nr:hypothetical protein B0T14DRAFT_524881 [Immersiella caudata]